VRVLVTGHRGYIGPVTTPLLAQGGHDLVGPDTDYYSDCDFGPAVSPVSSLRLDIRDVKPEDLAAGAVPGD
jgi:nucleoside-diphosphate-sugar epimerase